MSGERRWERETGIEPATNSLEGCDSTTELLPPTRLARIAAGKPATTLKHFASATVARHRQHRRLPTGTLACHLKSPAAHPISAPPHLRSLACHPKLARRRASNARAPPTERRVAREGLEPSKAQGRQIYSLLRLTASLPRRCVVWLKTLETLNPCAGLPRFRRKAGEGI